MSPVKTAEPTEIPFGLWTRISQGTMCQMGVLTPTRRGNFEGEKAQKGGGIVTACTVVAYRLLYLY